MEEDEADSGVGEEGKDDNGRRYVRVDDPGEKLVISRDELRK